MSLRFSVAESKPEAFPVNSANGKWETPSLKKQIRKIRRRVLIK